MKLSLFMLGCLTSMHRLVDAEQADVEEEFCDFSSEALTSFYGKNIPQTCINVPVSEVEFEERCFYSYVPESCSSEEISKAPLVMDIHGLGSCAKASASYTGWMEKAEEECIVMVWPNGNQNPIVGGCFSTLGFLQSEDVPSTEGEEMDVATLPCCCLAENLMPVTSTTDPLFLKMAIDTVVDSFETNDSLSIDNDRIYMAGHSNGCMMSLAMAALYSDTVAAVCCHAGAIVTPFPEDYSPVPIMMIQGMKDNTIPYGGSSMIDLPGIGPLGFFSVDQTINYLSDKNGCQGEGEMDVVDENGVVGTVFKRGQCEGNANVEVVALFEGDHNPYLKSTLGVPPTVDTTAMAWEFCSAYSKGAPEPAVVETPTEEETIVDVDISSETEDAEESSALTPKSYSAVLALALFLGAVVTV